jgi:hypothetical protein
MRVLFLASVKSSMKWLRTIRGFVRLLVALFLVAQFAGVVSSPLADEQPSPSAVHSHSHHQHGHDHADGANPHQHQHDGNPADSCCALHTYFAGVLPPVIEIATGDVISKSLVLAPAAQAVGVPPGRLDRPPRPPR